MLGGMFPGSRVCCQSRESAHEGLRSMGCEKECTLAWDHAPRIIFMSEVAFARARDMSFPLPLCSAFAFGRPGTPRLDTAEREASAVPSRPGPGVSLGPSLWLTFSQGCRCVQSILLAQRICLDCLALAVTWRAMCSLATPACSSLCKTQPRAGRLAKLTFHFGTHFRIAPGRTSTVASIWGVSQRSVVSLSRVSRDGTSTSHLTFSHRRLQGAQ